MKLLLRRTGIGLLIYALGNASGLAQGWQHVGKVERVEAFKEGLQEGVELAAGQAKVRITQFCNGVIRVRVAPNGHFPIDFSWALTGTPLNCISGPVQIHDGNNEVKMATGSVHVSIAKSPLLITFSDASDNVLVADEPSLSMAWDGSRVHAWKKMPPDENYYGLGDKAGPMNRRNRAFTNWNTDEFGWQESSDPLYKTIPFFIGLRKGVAYGVFFDNTYRSVFDFGKESRDYFSFGAEGGELNYYFTQWGMDPIWQTPKLAPVPRTTDFPSAAVPAWGLKLAETQDLTVDVAAHRVSFDGDGRQLWYSDIVFAEPNSYAPFVRLALARYQQHALPGVELSHVVLADFAQLTPDRAAALTSDPYAPRRLGLVVSGRAPEAPTRTEIVVTVQRRGANTASDLGWEDVPAGVATITPTPATTNVPDTALWIGAIEFAADPQEDEYRLVIREYEWLPSDAGEAMPAPRSHSRASSGGHGATHSSGAGRFSKRLVYAEFFPVHAGHPA